MNSPNSGREITLIVGVDSSSEEVLDQIQDIGAKIEEELFYNSLAVSIDETNLEALTSLDAVTTVELEGEWEQMVEGNFHIPDSAL